jgi:hypothetical protein
MNTTIEPVTLTIAEELDQALVRANITEAVLQQLLEKALPHAKPIENDEQFKAAERARLDIRQVRLLGEKGIEAVDRRYLELRQASLARKKELLEKINEPELLIEIHTTAWKRKLEAEEAERLRQIAEMQEARKAAIMGTGATFVPGPPAHKYVLGTTEVTVREVLEADHTTWGNLLRSFEVVAAELADLKAQEEREQRELLERLQEQERKQKEAQQELERRQRELEEKEAKMKQDIIMQRANQLQAACPDMLVGEGMLIAQLLDYTDEQWSAKVAEVVEEKAKAAEELRIAQEKAARQEQLRQEAEAAARVRLEAEQADPKTVTVERERLLRLLFSIQEMLPYAQAEGNDKWNAGLEQLSEDVIELRRDLGDETLGPTF